MDARNSEPVGFNDDLLHRVYRTPSYEQSIIDRARRNYEDACAQVAFLTIPWDRLAEVVQSYWIEAARSNASHVAPRSSTEESQ